MSSGNFLAELKRRNVYKVAVAVAIPWRLLSVPAGETISIARLKIDPVWDPIRKDPGFQQLLTVKELIGPNK